MNHDRLRGERALARAMISGAIVALRSTRQRADEEAWIASDSDEPCSFVWCCELTGLSPQWVRQNIAHWHARRDTPTVCPTGRRSHKRGGTSMAKDAKEVTLTLRPLNDRVLVQRCETPDVSEGGIILPDSAQQVSQEAEVVAVGPGCWDRSGASRIPLAVDVGMRVLLSRHVGINVTLNGDPYLVIQEEDILGVLRKAEA